MLGIVLWITTTWAAPFGLSPDPAPGLRHSRTWARNLDCERVSVETARQQHPGQIVTPGPRGDYVERSAVICRQRLTQPGLRDSLDEAILTNLEATTTELASAAEAMRPDLKKRTWLVQAYYASTSSSTAAVAAKISFATKNALMRRGLTVSDRTPTLASGDLEVLTRLPPDQAFPAACRRYAASGSLREGEALLAVVSRDPRATVLHAGICSRGQWMWLK